MAKSISASAAETAGLREIREMRLDLLDAIRGARMRTRELRLV
jgi:hypothetical protein